MSEFQPTEEQQVILDMFRTGESIAVQALAGTGKTRTLQMLAESCPNRTGVMTAFNKAICVEAAQKMPPSTSVSTMHSIAFRAVGRRYSHRLNSPRMKSMDIARLLRVDPMVIRYGSQSKPMAAGYLAGLVMRSIELFCQSGDPEPTERHVPYIDGIDLPASDGKRTYVNNNEVRRAILPAMRRAWADLMNHDGRLPFKHSHYLKSYALSDPKMLGDYLFIDEAGDLSGVMLSIIENQDHMQLVAAGDSRQTINEWLGAIDSLEKFPADRTAALTRSWRFGPAIADVGNGLLDRLGSDLHLVGGAPWASVVAPVAEPDCILTRTNAEAVRTVLDRMDRGQRVYLMGGGSEVVNFAKAARELMEGRWVGHPDLACFSDWGEVVSYTTEDAQGIELRLLVKLVEDYGPEAIVKGLSNATPESQADLTVSTCHRSKGREWGSVQLAGDFFDVREGEDDLNASELKLGYVGVTRAQRELDVTLCPQFLAKPEPKQPPLPAWLQTDDAPVSVPAAPQEPTATHTACPACGRTDVVRGGLIGAHRCVGAHA